MGEEPLNVKHVWRQREQRRVQCVGSALNTEIKAEADVLTETISEMPAPDTRANRTVPVRSARRSPSSLLRFLGLIALRSIAASK